MQAKQLFALTTLALAGSAVLAEEAPRAPLTRAEVAQSVLDARAAGTLLPAGEGDPDTRRRVPLHRTWRAPKCKPRCCRHAPTARCSLPATATRDIRTRVTPRRP